jgi:hypothetical protein
VRDDLRWRLFCQTESLSALQREWLDEAVSDPTMFPPFTEWLKSQQRKKLTPFMLFNALARSSGTLAEDHFLQLWQRLSTETQGVLLCFWRRIIECGSHHVPISLEPDFEKG